MDSHFEELSNDISIVNRMTQFSKTADDIGQMMKLIADPALYDTLVNTDKIKYNLMVSFALNSLFWMYLRAQGVDPTSHPIKAENIRLKQAMMRAQEINDRQTIMPRLNQNVAKRFIRNGLWVPTNTCDESNAHEDFNHADNWDIEHPDQPVSTDNV